jgi:hypothetical protein
MLGETCKIYISCNTERQVVQEIIVKKKKIQPSRLIIEYTPAVAEEDAGKVFQSLLTYQQLAFPGENTEFIPRVRQLIRGGYDLVVTLAYAKAPHGKRTAQVAKEMGEPIVPLVDPSFRLRATARSAHGADTWTRL